VRSATGPLTCLAAASVVALAACGVPPSSVIQAGEPAVGMPPAVSVYFLAGDSLLAVPRPGPSSAGLTTALRLLFEGPPAATGITRLTTELPPLPGPPTYTVKGTTVVVHLPADVDRLTRLATEQLVCTVAANWPGPPGRPKGLDPVGPSGAASGAAAATAVPLPTSASPDVIVLGGSWDLSGSTGNCP
jgi:hypothetical protein